MTGLRAGRRALRPGRPGRSPPSACRRFVPAERILPPGPLPRRRSQSPAPRNSGWPRRVRSGKKKNSRPGMPRRERNSDCPPFALLLARNCKPPNAETSPTCFIPLVRKTSPAAFEKTTIRTIKAVSMQIPPASGFASFGSRCPALSFLAPEMETRKTPKTIRQSLTNAPPRRVRPESICR